MNTITNETFSCVGEFSIGNNVWLGWRAVVLKNSCIPDGCIVAVNALVNKSFVTRQTLLAGNPAKERKHNTQTISNENSTYRIRSGQPDAKLL